MGRQAQELFERKRIMPQRVIDSIKELQKLVGQEVGVGDWFQVSQSLIDGFAEVTRDRQWIHVDAARAKAESPYGTTIAHGFLTLSLISHLHSQAVSIRGGYKMGINYGLNRVRFTSGVPAASRIRARSLLQSFEEISGGVQVTWQITIDIEGAPKPGLVAEWLVRFYF
jgi:acyl dehydratase